MLHYGCMKNINKTKKYSLAFGLGILAVLILGIMIAPENASAVTAGYANGYGSGADYPDTFNSNRYNTYQGRDYPVYYNYYEPTPVYVPTPTPVYVNPSPTVVYSSTVNPTATVKTTTTKTVAKAKTTTPKTTVAKATSEEESKLAASAIFGTNSLIPSGLIQWILFAILILLATILVRRIYGGNEKYNAVPLKHK